MSVYEYALEIGKTLVADAADLSAEIFWVWKEYCISISKVLLVLLEVYDWGKVFDIRLYDGGNTLTWLDENLYVMRVDVFVKFGILKYLLNEF